MNSKIEDLLNAVKLGELIHTKEEEKKKNPLLCVLAIIGAVSVVAGIAYAVYRYFTPDYLEDFEDDFDDDYDDCDDEEDTTEDKEDCCSDHTCCCGSSDAEEAKETEAE